MWQPRPALAWLLRAAAVVLPLGVASAVVHVAGRYVERPQSAMGIVVWFAGMSLLGSATLVAVDRFTRRLMPLAALYRLSLVFPGHAPRRYRTAIRRNTTRQLERRLKELDEKGLGSTPQEAAEKLLELVSALSAHDRLTRGHCERVRAYCDLVAEELHLTPDERSKLHWAGLLHDIGKLRVSRSILNKKGRPTDAEWEELRRHPEEGMKLVAPLAEWLGDWVHAVGQHHERFDGEGYPNRLAGHEISFAGRIVAVVDTYDVMTSVRSYQRPRSPAAARQELVRCSGTQFDPAVVRAFLNISVGRLRFAMGPLGSAAQLLLGPKVALAPIAAQGGSAIAAAGALAGSLLGIDVSTPVAPPQVVAAAEAPAPTASVEITTTGSTSTGSTAGQPSTSSATTTTVAPTTAPTLPPEPSTTLSITTTTIAPTSAPTTTVPLVAPALNAAVAGSQQVELRWAAGALVDSYVVRYRLAPAGAWSELPAANAPFTVTGLTNGLTYGFGVAARRGADQSGWSLERQAKPTLGTLGAGLLAYLPFDEASGPTAVDASGSGNSGVLLGDIERTDGRSGAGLRFAAGSAVRLPSTVAIGGKAISIAAWVRLETSTEWGDIVARQRGSSWEDQFALSTHFGKPTGGLSTPGGASLEQGPELPIGQWVHLALVYDGERLILYRNGAVVGSMPSAEGVQTESKPVTIGGSVNGSNPEYLNENFLGTIDEVRIYNRALSAAEVAELAR